jgi:predicted transcriptional regulator
MTNPTEFTDRELDIMGVLWRHGSGTVAEVREALGTDVGYTTVLKLLQILEEKGAVRHESEGRAYRYLPLTGADDAGGPALRRLLDTVFAGSAELALARLVTEAEPTAAELARMRRLLDELATSDPDPSAPEEP